MKIFVLNLCKRRLSYTLISIALVCVVLIATSIGVITGLYGKTLNIIPVDTVPYERLVILDAGHGGEDPGTTGVNGNYEKDLNLEIVMEIGKILEEKGYVIVYTRTDDKLLYTEEENIKGIRKISDLKNRCKVANRYPESIMVSIHMNSFGDGKYSGLQVYHKPSDQNSKLLADKIQSSVQSTLQRKISALRKTGTEYIC